MARPWLALLAVVAVAGIGGCATVPASGAARPLADNSGPPEAFIQPLPPPAPGPQAKWSAQDVVEGFLQASASDPAAAKDYLAPGVKWEPPAAVTVVNGSSLKVNQTADPKLGSNFAEVTVTGQRLASLSDTGQYLYQPGAANYAFKLGLYNDVWLIVSLPPQQQLLLTQTDFQEVYQPRNLWFFSQSGDVLVPDPVFAPVQGVNAALSTDLAADLINGLIDDSGSWLSGATTTDFPAGTRLLSVSISNQTAVVNLGGAARATSAAQRYGMYAQLSLTLTSSAYSQPIAGSVQLEIDGAVQYGPQDVSGPAPAQAENLYFADGYVVKALPTGARSATSAMAFPFLGGEVTAVALSRVGRQQLAVAVPDGRACAVEVGELDNPGSYASYTLGDGACTSLSWDNSGDLWAVAGGRIWVLQPGYSKPVQVNVPSLAPGSRVLALRIEADDVRVALLVQAPGSGSHLANQLFLSAVWDGSAGVQFGPTVPIGTDLADPTAISWYGPYNLVALDGADMYEVPLTGGQSQSLGPVPSGSLSITSDGTAFAAGTGTGEVWVSPAPDGTWALVGRATAVAYPG